MRLTFFTAGCLFMAACASRSRAPGVCEPPPPEFLRAGEVYAECAVDRKVDLRVMGRPDMTGFRPNGSTACVFADIDVVIDTTGLPVTQTTKVARTNDVRYAELARMALASTTFYPAKKGDRPVMQLHRYSSKVQMITVVGPGGSMPTRPTSRPPVC